MATRELGTFRNGLRNQLVVVGALVLREMQARHGRSNIGYLWAFVEPLILLAVFVVLFEFVSRRAPSGMELVPFLVTGILTFLALRRTTSLLSGAVTANRGLLLYPQVTPLDVMLGRAVLELATFPVLFVVIIGGAYLADMSPAPDDPARVLLAIFAVMMLAVAIGMLQGSLISIFPVVQHVLTPLWRVLLFTSCVFYTLDELPTAAQNVIYWNPIAHAIELLRSGFFAHYESRLASFEYLLMWIIASLFLGLLFERMIRARTNNQ